MAMTGKVRKILVVSAVAVVGLLAIAWLSRNMIATAVTRTVATRLLGVPVEVDAVRIDVFGLAVEVDGIRVSNPQGWGTPRAMEIDHLGVRVGSESSAKRLVVDDIALRGVRIWFIRDGLRNNISELVGNLSGPKDDKPAEPSGPGMELLIRRLALEQVEVRYGERSSAPAGEIPVVASLAKVEVRDIDARTGGKGLAEQLVAQVFEATVVAVVKSAGGKLPAAVGDAVGSAVQAGGRLGKEALTAIGDASKGATEAVGGLLKGIGDAIGGKNGGK